MFLFHQILLLLFISDKHFNLSLNNGRSAIKVKTMSVKSIVSFLLGLLNRHQQNTSFVLVLILYKRFLLECGGQQSEIGLLFF